MSTQTTTLTARPSFVPVPNVISLLFILLIALNYFEPFADLDFAWQIRTGEHIVREGTLRLPESFSYTINGVIVPDFEWLYEVVLYLVWEGFGFGGLKILRVVLVGTPLLIVALHLRAQGIRWRGIAITLLLAVTILTPAWNLRPLFCTTIGLLLVTTMLHDHCTGRRPLSAWLPIVMLLWANLHPGVIMGQGLLVGAIGWEWLNRWIRLNRPLDLVALRRLTLIAGLGLAATFLSPDPIERFLYPFKPELKHPVMRIFAEMTPLYQTFPSLPLPIGLAYVVALLVGLSVLLRFRDYRLWEVMLLGGLAMLANFAFRSLQDWLLVMLALGVPHLAVLLRRVAEHRRQTWAALLLRADRFARRMLLSPLFRFQAFWPLAFTATLLVVSLIPPLSRNMPLQNGSDWPVAAVDYIERHRLHGRFFSPPDYGAFLVWRLPGKALSYTDTRGFFFPPKLIEDSHFVPQLRRQWQARLERILDEHHTDYFLLETTGARGEMWRRLQPHTTPLFKDDMCVLLTAAQVRQGLEKAATAEDAKADPSSAIMAPPRSPDVYFFFSSVTPYSMLLRTAWRRSICNT